LFLVSAHRNSGRLKNGLNFFIENDLPDAFNQLMMNDAVARRPASPRRCLQSTFTGV
jgi:hypothetical protein